MVCMILQYQEMKVGIFGKLGQVLERADKTSRVLDANTIICLSRPSK
jgi:uncharacterized alpha-E superfamily protein